MIDSDTPDLSPQTVRVLRIIGRLWPEVTALFAYIVFLWTPLIHAYLLEHEAWTGAAIIGFTWLTHQERPAWERTK